MEKELLRQIVIDQQDLFKKVDNLIERSVDLNYFLKGEEIVIISGIRRCGKSSLLKLISEKYDCIKIFVNFDDVRFVDFEIKNFQDLEEIFLEIGGQNKVVYFFDEIQNLKHWEKWVNNLHSKKIKVFITGSNANLLSSEISTYLTGRNKVIKLFPFSFKEYLNLKKIDSTYSSTKEKVNLMKHFNNYFNIGGFPQVIKNEDLELSKQYFEDILNKDLIIRYKIKDIKELKDLIIFLLSNIGKINSYTTLKQITGIKSLSTIKKYLDGFQNVFLLHQVNKFDYSINKQKVAPSKIYTYDNSFLKTVSFNFSENFGKRLENLVFIHLLRTQKNVYYHLNKKECDFIIKEGLKVKNAIQVTLNLDKLTKEREITGLLEAMEKYNLKEGLILNLENEETIKIENKIVYIKPIWKWLLE